ncbi:MAG: hypothetical protein ACXVVK_19470 [Solirubrobacteraceae bacterium]
MPVEVSEQLVERVGDVSVAQIPAARLIAEYRALVLLGIRHHRRVLFGTETLVFGARPSRRR